MQITRRDALVGAGAAAMAAGVPGTTTAADRVIVLVRDQRAARKRWRFIQDTFEEICHRAGFSLLAGRKASQKLNIEPLWEELEHWKAQYWDLRARVLDTPATTPHGVLAKFRGFYHDGEITDIRAGGDPDDDLPKEFAASIYRDLERLAGEARS